MNKSSVRLKVLFLLLLSVHLVSLETTESTVTEDDREARLESESIEKEWVNKYVNNLNGTNKIKADFDTIETTSTTPPRNDVNEVSIECAHFDESACEKNGSCEVTKKTCYSENHLRIVGCLAIFSAPLEYDVNTTETFLKVERRQFKNLGCMAYQHEDSMSCLDPEQCRQDRPFRNSIGICCCTTANCNSPGNIYMQLPLSKDDESSISQDSPGWSATSSTDDFEALDISPTYWWITISLFLILLAALLLLSYIAWRYYKTKRMGKNKKKSDMEKTNALEAGHLPLVEEDLMIELVETPKELPITEFQLISKGRFGKVYKAKWTENGETHDVAVKKLSFSERPSYEAEKRIFEELVSFPKWYPSIVKFNCAENIGDEYCIVTEFHKRLSLFEMLQHNVISITAANRIIMTMIDGLQFLHDDRPFFFGHSKKPIIHRDIKSKNILVKEDMTTCIADFGLARIYDFDIEKSDLLGQVGTKRYMSPEMLEGATEFTATAFKAMDVYSMGLVMWEVISRTKLKKTDVVPDYQLPFQQIGYNPSIGYMRNHVVSKKERPPFRAEVRAHSYMSSLAGVTEEMWDPEACARITAGCAFARVWDLVMNSADSSEGYHSGNSLKEREEDAEEREYMQSMKRNPEEIEAMIKYHASSGAEPHPSPDPCRDSCPPPPSLPEITDSGVNYKIDLTDEQINRQPQLQQQQEEDLILDEPPVEKVFDVEMNRMLTQEEIELWESREHEEVDTRASTPTPSGSFF